MKKLILVLIGIFVLGSVVVAAAEDVKVIKVSKDITVVTNIPDVTAKVVEPAKEVVSLDSYAIHRSAGKSLEAAGKFLDASDEFIKAADEASKLVGKIEYTTGSPEQSQAWQLNSAALCIIEQHQKDATGDLSKAKDLLNKSLALKDIHLDCAAVAKRNLEYVEFWLSKVKVGKTVDAPKKVEVKSEGTTKVGK